MWIRSLQTRSSAALGSSMIRTHGSFATAHPMLNLFFMPPDILFTGTFKKSFMWSSSEPITAEEISGNPEITTYDVIGGRQKGDELMTKIFRRWQDDIMLGLVGLANIFDPSVIVLSGSLAEFVDTDYLTREVNSQIVTTPTVVKKAEAGNYSGMIGAALLALEAVRNG